MGEVITVPLKYFVLDRCSKLFPVNTMCQTVELVKERNVIKQIFFAVVFVCSFATCSLLSHFCNNVL